jgi:hypothetical protein
MLISKPGFYHSKAGKCEVVAVQGAYAFGRTPHGYPAVWHTNGTLHLYDGTSLEPGALDITGPWPPRKPVEAWVEVHDDGHLEFALSRPSGSKTYRGYRLIRLIEAPE